MEPKIGYVGTLKIVSSGYTDRYILNKIEAVITIESITYRVDTHDSMPAYARIAWGKSLEDCTHEERKKITDVFSSAKCSLSIWYESSDNATVSFFTTATKMEIAVSRCLGTKPLIGCIKAENIDLSQHEINCAKYWLNKINEDYIRKGKLESVVPLQQ